MTTPKIFIVSGGNGASGELVVHTVLAQFPGIDIAVQTFPFVKSQAEIEGILVQAAEEQAVVVHTLVHPGLSRALVGLSEVHGVTSVDLMGNLLKVLTERTGVPPAGKPGRYRELHLDYFQRVEAIEFALSHDDGQRLGELAQADIILIGPSRVGKTPLSIYLSVLGWRTANVPLVPEVPAPAELLAVDRRRVIGLVIEPELLQHHRRKRQSELGLPGGGASYADPSRIFDEIEAVERFFKRGGFTTINVTGQPIETSATLVIEIIRGRFPEGPRKRSSS